MNSVILPLKTRWTYSIFQCRPIYVSRNLNVLPVSSSKHQKRNLQTLIRNYENFQRNLLKQKSVTSYLSNISQRSIWTWLNSVFNRVDEDRILNAGPDRACAEWLLRCGAAVKWIDSENWLKDYNSLSGSSCKLKIQEVDATDSAIMHIGFPYFKNCKAIRRIVFHRAVYLDDLSLHQLCYVENSLKELQISSCGNISKSGLMHLKQLRNLEYLLLYDLPLISNKEKIIEELQKALPQCEIYFPYAQASERPQEENEVT